MLSLSELHLNESLPVLHLTTNNEGLLVDDTTTEHHQASHYASTLLPTVSPTMKANKVHQMVCDSEPVPQAFAAKLVGLHLGQLSLSVTDVTDYLVFLERRFRVFAFQLPEFRALTPADQESLLVANAPLYLQLHMAMYANANGGTSQVRSLIGASQMADFIQDLDKNLLTVSCNYFCSATVLFKQRLWADFYEVGLLKFSRFADSLTSSSSSQLGSFIACILFSHNCVTVNEDFDDPGLVVKSWRKHAISLSSSRTFLCYDQVHQGLESLRSLAHFYSAHANIGYASCASPGGSSGAYEEVSFTEPSAEEERHSLDRLSSAFTKAWQHHGVSEHSHEDLLKVGLAFAMPNPDSTRWVQETAKGLFKRRLSDALSMLEAEEGPFPYSETDRERRLDLAVSLSLSRLASAETGQEQVDLLLGQRDKELWTSWFGDGDGKLFRRLSLECDVPSLDSLVNEEAFSLSCFYLLSHRHCVSSPDRISVLLGNVLNGLYGQTEGVKQFVMLSSTMEHLKNTL